LGGIIGSIPGGLAKCGEVGCGVGAGAGITLASNDEWLLPSLLPSRQDSRWAIVSACGFRGAGAASFRHGCLVSDSFGRDRVAGSVGRDFGFEQE